MINRRSLITGLISLVAAPAIVRVANIMPVRPVIDLTEIGWTVPTPNANWHLSFWCNGHDWKLGDEIGMHDQRFTVDGIENITNESGKVWQYVTGRSVA